MLRSFAWCQNHPELPEKTCFLGSQTLGRIDVSAEIERQLLGRHIAQLARSQTLRITFSPAGRAGGNEQQSADADKGKGAPAIRD